MLKKKTVTRNKGHFIMIKGSVDQEGMRTINTYALNSRSPKYMRQKLTELKGETDDSIVIVVELITPFPIMDRITR